MIRVLVHAGFHKTGTTSVQRALAANRSALAPHLAVGLRADLVDVAETARAYSVGQEPAELAILQGLFAAYLSGLGLTEGQALLISSEDLSGHMPGRRGLASYAAAPALMRAVAAGAKRVLRGALDLTFVFSTRAPEAWIRSLYWQQLLRADQLDDLDAFRASIAGAEDLGAVVDAIAEAVPRHRVRRFALEDCGSARLGPLDPILEMAGMAAADRARLVAVPPAKTRPRRDLSEEFLALNRSGLGDAALKAAKDALIRAARQEEAAERAVDGRHGP